MWTEEQKRTLISMIDDGRTFTEIGIALDKPRGSISGQVWRLKLKSKSGQTGGPAFKPGNWKGVVMDHHLKPDWTWPDDRVEKLKELWAQGVSMVGIGHEIGMTHKAVARAAARYGLPTRPKPKRFSMQPMNVKPKQVKPPTPIRSDDGVEGVPLHECDGCRWPVNSWRLGNGFEARFCGAETAQVVRRGKMVRTWVCEGHARVAFRAAA